MLFNQSLNDFIPPFSLSAFPLLSSCLIGNDDKATQAASYFC
jgi:hypothetical protein